MTKNRHGSKSRPHMRLCTVCWQMRSAKKDFASDDALVCRFCAEVKPVFEHEPVVEHKHGIDFDKE